MPVVEKIVLSIARQDKETAQQSLLIENASSKKENLVANSLKRTGQRSNFYESKSAIAVVVILLNGNRQCRDKHRRQVILPAPSNEDNIDGTISIWLP